MATGTPIVSTAVADVIANFGDVVHVAKSSSEFIAECARCVQNPDRERIQRGVEMARNNTWEKIVRSLEGHIHDVLEEKARQARLEDDVMTVESSIATKTLLSVQGQTGEVEYV